MPAGGTILLQVFIDGESELIYYHQKYIMQED